MIVVLAQTDDRAEVPPEYGSRAARMQEIVQEMPGFLGSKAYTAADGERITLWRFASEEALEAWRTHPEHLDSQEFGRQSVFDHYWGQVCRVIRQYEFKRGAGRREIPADQPWWPAYGEDRVASPAGAID
jgi:heme-degrading monooxygenase HmoA